MLSVLQIIIPFYAIIGFHHNSIVLAYNGPKTVKTSLLRRHEPLIEKDDFRQLHFVVFFSVGRCCNTPQNSRGFFRWLARKGASIQSPHALV